jgi:nucleotide-binding universal stress UspA family protein
VAVFVEEDEALDYMSNVKRLHCYMDFLRESFPGIRFQGEVLEGKDFELTIDRYDNNNEVDIIAMITYPKNLLQKLLKKSVTKKMAFHSTIPLLAIPA